MFSSLKNTSVGLESKLYGCWLGKSIGGTLGLPVEGRTERLSLTYYDPIPTEAPPNDDLELQLVWLKIVEEGKSILTRQDFADAWLRHIHYMWDEYGRCRWNLRRGVPLERIGSFENPFASAMGSPIRSELWACLFTNDPASAAYYAALDSTLDHGIEGIAGEVFCAVLQCHAAAGAEILEALDLALQRLPASTETARTIALVLDGHRRGLSEWPCRDLLLKNHNHENFTHAPLNVALVAWALAYGKGDFETSILLCVNGGYDTDSTGATVGATLGLRLGADAIPSRWKSPIGDGVYLGPGILDLDAPRTLQELTQRQGALIGKLQPKTWDDVPWREKTSEVDLNSLPGTIHLRPHGSSEEIPWANGELPIEVKEAGGATWQWEKSDDAPRSLIALARRGAKISIDGQLIIDCSAGLPYVPATHRCPLPARTMLNANRGTHEIRLDLGGRNGTQDATVLLAYPNLHLAPWTQEEIEHPARL
jgi:ADP-ribosylglycohydrolase